MPTLEKERDVKERKIIDQQISAEDYKKLIQRLKRVESRMRLQELVWYLPFAFLAGGLVALAVALYSRFTPSLTVEQLLVVSAAVLLIALGSSIAYSIFRPRNILDTARRADVALGMKQRVSTAIEGYNRPKKLGYVAFGEKQFNDAKDILEKSKANKALPLKIHKKVGLAALLLIPLLGLALFLPNDNAAIAKDNEALGQQVDKEAKALDDLKNKLKDEAKKYNLPENDPKLQELLKEIDQAKKDLQNNKLNRDQALASLEKAQQDLSKLSEQQQNQAQKAAFESLARDFRSIESTKPAGDALSQQNDPNRFDKAASELEKAADNVDKLKNDPAQAKALADALEKNAKNFEKSNPDLSDKLNKAAQSLQQNNLQQNPAAAQQALKDLAKDVAQAGRDQQFQEQLQQAQSQLQKSQQAIGQSGQRSQTSTSSKAGQKGDDFGKSGDQSDSLGQAGDPTQGDSQNNLDPTGSNGQNPSGQSGQSQGQQLAKGQGQGQSGQNSGVGKGQNQGQGQDGAGDATDQTQGQGQGQGAGQNGNGNGTNPNGSQGKGAGKGSVDKVYQKPTDRNTTGTRQTVKGKDGDGPNSTQNVNAGDATGAAQVPYTDVINDYSQSASQSLDKNYVPLTLKDIVKQYFDDLQKRS